jgi:hypothetical protein
MKVSIKTIIHMPEIPTEVEMETGTLRTLLLHVFSHVHFSKEIMDQKTGEFKDDSIFQPRLNGRRCDELAKGWDTELSDGDVVTLSLVMLGGG